MLSFVFVSDHLICGCSIELAVSSSFSASGTFSCQNCYIVVGLVDTATFDNGVIQGSGAFESVSDITFNGTNIIQPQCAKVGASFVLLPGASLIAPTCGFPAPSDSTGSSQTSSGGGASGSSGSQGGSSGDTGNGATVLAHCNLMRCAQKTAALAAHRCQ